MVAINNQSASPAVVFDWLALNVIDALLTIGGTGTYFKHTLETHIPFAQELYTQEFTGMTYSKLVNVSLEKTHDYVCNTAMHLVLPGIIGVQSSATTSTGYPYLRSSSTCGNGNFNCVPAQEMSALDYDLDFLDSAIASGGHLVHNPFAHWVYGAGFRFIEQIQLLAGTLPAETHDFRFLYAWEELSGGAGKRQTFQAQIASTREELIRSSLNDQHLYVNIPFWFTYFYGNSLSIVRSQLAKLSYGLNSAAHTDLIVCSDEQTLPYLSQKTSAATTVLDWRTNSSDARTHDMESTGTAVAKDNALTVEMVQQIVYLEDSHRRAELAKAEDHEMNVLMIVTESETVAFTNASTFKITLEGSNPVIELVIMCQLDANQEVNDWFNFSRIGPASGRGKGPNNLAYTDGSVAFGSGVSNHERRLGQVDADPISTLTLKVNQQQRIHSAPAAEFRVLTPRLTHSNLPNKWAGAYIYVIPISIYPEDASGGGGSCNMGRVDNFTVSGAFDAGVVRSNVKVHMYVNARMWSIWSYYGHTSGPRFAHQFSAS